MFKNIKDGFSKTFDNGEIEKYMNNDLYRTLIEVLFNLDFGIDCRDKNMIRRNLTKLIEAISHFPSIKALLES